MERSLNHKPFQILDQPCHPLSCRRPKNLKTSVRKVWDWDYWVQKSMWRQSKARDDWEPGLLNVLQPNSVFDGNVWLRQRKIKTNIWTHCALSPSRGLDSPHRQNSGLTGLNTIDYKAIVSDLPEPKRRPAAKSGLSRQINGRFLSTGSPPEKAISH